MEPSRDQVKGQSANWSSLSDRLSLPTLTGAMDALSERTAIDSKERGACIVGDPASPVLAHEVLGTRWGVTPMHRVGDFADHHGFFHTHPLRSDGSAQVGFSDTDFTGMIDDGCCLALAHNGPGIYALVRTSSTPSGPVTPAEEARFLHVFVDCMSRFADRANAERAANLELARQLGLAFYEGETGQPLRRLR